MYQAGQLGVPHPVAGGLPGLRVVLGQSHMETLHMNTMHHTHTIFFGSSHKWDFLLGYLPSTVLAVIPPHLTVGAVTHVRSDRPFPCRSKSACCHSG